MERYHLNYPDMKKIKNKDLKDKEWVSLYQPKGLGDKPDFSIIAPNAKKIELGNVKITDINFGPNVEAIEMYSISGIEYIDFAKAAPNAKDIRLTGFYVQNPGQLKFGSKLEDLRLHDNVRASGEWDFAKIAPTAKRIALRGYWFDKVPFLVFGPNLQELYLIETMYPFHGQDIVDFGKIAPSLKTVSFRCSTLGKVFLWFGNNVEDIDLSETIDTPCIQFEERAPNAKKINLYNARIGTYSRVSAPLSAEVIIGGRNVEMSLAIKNGLQIVHRMDR